jgi:hypothetical protein
MHDTFYSKSPSTSLELAARIDAFAFRSDKRSFSQGVAMQRHPHIEINEPVDFPLDFTSFSVFVTESDVLSRLRFRL